jgi:sugar phosphate isomerase/epimerase
VNFKGIGYGVQMGSSPQELTENLQTLIDCGYDYVEVSPASWRMWVGGRVDQRRLKQLVAVLDKFRDRLGYTFHLPGETNLFDVADLDYHQALLEAGLEVGKAVGATALAYHAGYRLALPAGTSKPMQELMARERDILLSHADEVASWGGNISIETHGFIENASYTAFPEMHARFVESIDHPGIGVCIDFGHSFLSSQWNGFDYLEGIARLAPLTTHFHVQDNMGISAYSGRTSLALGRGDLHLAPGDGAVPFNEVFSTIDFPQKPVFMVEALRYGHDLRDGQAARIFDESVRLAGLPG